MSILCLVILSKPRIIAELQHLALKIPVHCRAEHGAAHSTSWNQAAMSYSCWSYISLP